MGGWRAGGRVTRMGRCVTCPDSGRPDMRAPPQPCFGGSLINAHAHADTRREGQRIMIEWNRASISKE